MAPQAAPQAQPVPRGQVRVQPGDIVLVRIDEDTRRPLLVTWTGMITVHEDLPPSFRVSGTIFCEPDDHTRPGFRGGYDRRGDPARLHGRPDRLTPLGYGEHLSEGSGPAQWITRAR